MQYVKTKKSYFIFTLLITIYFLFNCLFSYMIKNNKQIPMIIESPNSVKLEGNFNTEGQGFWYNFATSNNGVNDVKYKYNLILIADYYDINNNWVSFDYTFTYEYENTNPLKTDFDIFNESFDMFNNYKIETAIKNAIDYKVNTEHDVDYYMYKNIDNPFERIYCRITIPNFSDVTDDNYGNYYYFDTSLSISSVTPISNSNLSISYYVPNQYYFQTNTNVLLDFTSSSSVLFDNCVLLDFYVPIYDSSNEVAFYEYTFKNYNQESNLLQMISSLQNDVNYYQNKFYELKSQYNDLLVQYVEASNSNVYNQQEISELNSNILDLNSQIELLNTSINEKNARITELTNLLNSSRNSEWKFNNILWNIASSPLESFKTFYNVEFMGVNLSDLFLGIVFSGLIFFLFRRFIGSFFSL